MSATKFTPGPWRYSIATDGKIVAPQERGVDVEVVEADAANPHNSRLIAAAPELYALLEIAACPCCDGSGAYYDGYGEVCQCQWCDERTKVIAKARGDS